jgi:hypothetical protein
MTGAVFGKATTFGAYAGIASYVNTGEKDIETSTNDFYVWTPSYPDPKRVERGNSAIGAPHGPVSACIAEVKDGLCDGNRIITPGEYKFSVFGYTFDQSDGGFAENVQAGKNGIPDPVTHFGVRMKISTVGFRPEGITFNGGEHTLSTLGSNQVASFELLPGDGSVITYEFPQRYNWGTVGSWAGGMLPVNGTADVQIRVSAAGADAVHVDYMFEFSHVREANMYFVYDPSVSSATAENSGRLSRAFIAGIAAGSAVLFVILSSTAYCIVKKKLCFKAKVASTKA